MLSLDPSFKKTSSGFVAGSRWTAVFALPFHPVEPGRFSQKLGVDPLDQRRQLVSFGVEPARLIELLQVQEASVQADPDRLFNPGNKCA